MGLISKSLKLGIPSGLLYYTFKEGLWMPPDNQAYKHSVNVIDKSTRDAEQIVKPYVSPYLSGIKLPNTDWLSKDKLICWWNCGVRITIRSIADFDPIKTADRLMDKLNSQTSPADPPGPAQKES